MRRSWKNGCFALFLLAGLWVGLTRPFAPDLSGTGHLVVMSLLWVTGLWVFEPFGLSVGVGSCLFPAVLLASGVPADAAFSGFTQPAVWTLIPALFFGFALKKTGLGARIAYWMLRSMRVVTYPSLLLIWTVIGVALSLLTPSITVRVVIVTPLALNCADLCGLPEHSRGRSLVLLTAWAMSVIPGIGWSTGSLMGPILTGIFSSAEGMPEVTFAAWSRVALLPAAVVSVLLSAGGLLVLRPEQPLHVSREVFQSTYRSLPPFSKQEKITGAVLTLCFCLFATGGLHGIPDAATCLLGFLLLAASGVIGHADVGGGISWDLVLFVGTSMSFGEVFAVSGVSDWLSAQLLPLFSPITGNPWLLVLVMLAFLFLWRFFDVALLTPTIVILTPVLPKLWTAYGIHPLVWIPLFSFSICAFFMRYENMFLLIGEAGMQGRGWTDGHRFRYAAWYFAACLLAMLIAVPYWRALGLFGTPA